MEEIRVAGNEPVNHDEKMEEMTKKILEMEIEETIPKPPPVVEVERKRSLLSKIWNG